MEYGTTVKVKSVIFTQKQLCYTFVFFLGPDPGAAVKFGPGKFVSKVRWSVTTKLASESSVSLTIGSSPDAPIGVYQLALEFVGREVKEVSLGQFVLLFNPWCKSKMS